MDLPVEGRVEIRPPGQGLGTAHVQAQGRHAGEAVEHGLGVTARGLGVGGARVAADPEVGRVAGIDTTFHEIVVDPVVLTREVEPLRFALGEVHIPDAVGGQVHGLPALQEARDPGLGLFQGPRGVDGEGRGPGTLHPALEGGTHGAGIEHILAQVEAMVDPRKHPVGLAAQDFADAQQHAVHGGAVTGEAIRTDLIQPQDVVQAEGRGDGRAVAVGGHGDHPAEG